MHDIIEQAQDKVFLRSIVENNYRLPADIDAHAFAKALLDNLGTLDAELRDELLYLILAHAFIDDENAQRFSTAQVEDVLLTSIDEQHLFYGIGETETDSVFMRSFSNLIVAAILFADRKQQRLSEQVVRQLQEALLHYTREERDWRGYVQGKGWAHAAAHLADTLDEIAQSRYATTADREAVLEALAHLAKLPVPLSYEEDERLAFGAYGIIARQQQAEPFVKNWLHAFIVVREETVPGGTEADVASWVSAANAKNFLRSLYFRLLWSSKAAFLLEPILNILKKLDPLPSDWAANAE
ncbi:MAG TPA: DUF2785 domain-containing protein [Ktedonobacteraceae bacterium]|jgi:hypothetical protein|nr:DUF2785 domain-containing protein [Ktedonobacteraceae bacterium]